MITGTLHFCWSQQDIYFMLAGYFSLSCYNNINCSMQTKTMRRNLNLLTVCCIPGFKTYQPFDWHFLLIVLVSCQSYQYAIYIATNSNCCQIATNTKVTNKYFNVIALWISYEHFAHIGPIIQGPAVDQGNKNEIMIVNITS